MSSVSPRDQSFQYVPLRLRYMAIIMACPPSQVETILGIIPVEDDYRRAREMFLQARKAMKTGSFREYKTASLLHLRIFVGKIAP